MEIVNIAEARRFSRDRPTRVAIFDRPRLVCDLVCLEPGQQEARQQHSSSDELYLVVEGKAQVRVGAQPGVLEPNDVLLVPPGVDHTISNPGPGRLVLMVMIAPKPGRTSEVKLPAPPEFPVREGAPGRDRREQRPFREGAARRDRREERPAREAVPGRGRREERPGREGAGGREREERPARFDSRPPRSGPGTRPRSSAPRAGGGRPRPQGRRGAQDEPAATESARAPRGRRPATGGRSGAPRSSGERPAPPGKRQSPFRNARRGPGGPPGRRGPGRSGPRPSRPR